MSSSATVNNLARASKAIAHALIDTLKPSNDLPTRLTDGIRENILQTSLPTLLKHIEHEINQQLNLKKTTIFPLAKHVQFNFAFEKRHVKLDVIDGDGLAWIAHVQGKLTLQTYKFPNRLGKQGQLRINFAASNDVKRLAALRAVKPESSEQYEPRIHPAWYDLTTVFLSRQTDSKHLSKLILSQDNLLTFTLRPYLTSTIKQSLNESTMFMKVIEVCVGDFWELSRSMPTEIMALISPESTTVCLPGVWNNAWMQWKAKNPFSKYSNLPPMTPIQWSELPVQNHFNENPLRTQHRIKRLGMVLKRIIEGHYDRVEINFKDGHSWTLETIAHRETKQKNEAKDDTTILTSFFKSSKRCADRKIYELDRDKVEEAGKALQTPNISQGSTTGMQLLLDMRLPWHRSLLPNTTWNGEVLGQMGLLFPVIIQVEIQWMLLIPINRRFKKESALEDLNLSQEAVYLGTLRHNLKKKSKVQKQVEPPINFALFPIFTYGKPLKLLRFLADEKQTISIHQALHQLSD